MLLVFKFPSADLAAKFINGVTLIVGFAKSNTTSPGVSSILSLIVSRLSNGNFSSDVLFVEYMFLIYHFPPVGTFVVVMTKALPVISAVPNSESNFIFC